MCTSIYYFQLSEKRKGGLCNFQEQLSIPTNRDSASHRNGDKHAWSPTPSIAIFTNVHDSKTSLGHSDVTIYASVVPVQSVKGGTGAS